MSLGKHFVLLLFFISFIQSSLAWRQLERVSFKFFNSDQLTRLPEFFSGKEYSGSRIFCRTNPERAGLYFSFSLDEKLSKLPLNTKIILSIIREGRKRVEIFPFKMPNIRNGKKSIFLGLTGKDWADGNANPVAWKIEIQNLNVEILFYKQSFLWSHD